MYQKYWQLREKPFENVAPPQFFFPSESHQGTLLKLRYAVENHRGGALLIGESGTGKTLVLRLLAKQLQDTVDPVVHVVFPQMPCAELLHYIADELTGPNTSARDTVEASFRRIRDKLLQNAEQGRHALIVIDEAHLLQQQDTLEALRLLLNIESPQGLPMTLILAGQPELLSTMERMPQLEERMGVKCLLRPLGLEETISYVNHRLQSANARKTIFTEQAMDAIYQATQGAPRRINRLCDLALLIGFAGEHKQITDDQVESIAQELVPSNLG